MESLQSSETNSVLNEQNHINRIHAIKDQMLSPLIEPLPIESTAIKDITPSIFDKFRGRSAIGCVALVSMAGISNVAYATDEPIVPNAASIFPSDEELRLQSTERKKIVTRCGDNTATLTPGVPGGSTDKRSKYVHAKALLSRDKKTVDYKYYLKNSARYCAMIIMTNENKQIVGKLPTRRTQTSGFYRTVVDGSLKNVQSITFYAKRKT